MRMVSWIIQFLIICSVILFTSCARRQEYINGKKVITYWEKYTGFERDAMQRVVDKFNGSQDSIFVKMVTVSNILNKLIVSTAGGVPPDMAGIYTTNIPGFADKGAIMDLSGLFRKAGIKKEAFLPNVWRISSYKGRVWGFTSVPFCTALHWNKRLFKAAGLDPNVPPRTIRELTDFADRIALFENRQSGQKYSYHELKEKFGTEEAATSHILENDLVLVRAGFLPCEPN
jgi:ABC-type glycerol-3-phosphate transport system substrate-binding protein